MLVIFLLFFSNNNDGPRGRIAPVSDELKQEGRRVDRGAELDAEPGSGGCRASRYVLVLYVFPGFCFLGLASVSFFRMCGTCLLITHTYSDY